MRLEVPAAVFLSGHSNLFPHLDRPRFYGPNPAPAGLSISVFDLGIGKWVGKWLNHSSLDSIDMSSFSCLKFYHLGTAI